MCSIRPESNSAKCLQSVTPSGSITDCIEFNSCVLSCAGSTCVQKATYSHSTMTLAEGTREGVRLCTVGDLMRSKSKRRSEKV